MYLYGMRCVPWALLLACAAAAGAASAAAAAAATRTAHARDSATATSGSAQLYHAGMERFFSALDDNKNGQLEEEEVRIVAASALL